MLRGDTWAQSSGSTCLKLQCQHQKKPGGSTQPPELPRHGQVGFNPTEPPFRVRRSIPQGRAALSTSPRN